MIYIEDSVYEKLSEKIKKDIQKVVSEQNPTSPWMSYEYVYKYNSAPEHPPKVSHKELKIVDREKIRWMEYGLSKMVDKKELAELRELKSSLKKNIK